MMIQSKKILVLPGSKWQVPLVKKIKQMGHKAFVVNPYKDSPCFAYANEYLQTDIFNIDKVISFAEKNSIDGIVSDECDIAMNLIAFLGERFNVPTISQDVASLYTNKYLMREYCKKHGLLYPEYKLCTFVEEAIEFLLKLNRPIIIKPINSNASHGVFKCNSSEDVISHFDESKNYSRNSNQVLVERYIEGTEFTIDGIKTPHRHYSLAISEKKHYEHNRNIANELYFTHTNRNFDYNKLKRINDLFVDESDLYCGLTHAEYKYENGEFYLIEIAARGGGNLISSHIVPFMSGIDTYKYLIDYAIGNSVSDRSFANSQVSKNSAVLKFFDVHGSCGVVDSIDGLDYLTNDPNVIVSEFNFKIGDKIHDAENDSNRIGYYIACSKNEESLQNTISMINSKIHINIK